MVTETVNSARPDLANPRRFVAQACRDLARAWPAAWQLFRARVSGQNRQSWLGWLWLFLPTFGIVMTCIFIQRRAIVAIGSTDIPYPAFVITGLIAWQTFTDAINAPLRRLDEAKALIALSDVPHEAMLIAAIFDTALVALTRLCVALPVVALFWAPAGWGYLLMPAVIVALILFGVAIGILLAPVGLLAGDVRQAMSMALVVWLFVTPVFYPVPAHGWLALNPARPLIEAFRITAGGGVPDGAAVAFLAIGPLLAIAWILYRVARPLLAERVG